MPQLETSTAERVQRLETAYARFRHDEPDIAQALDVLGISVEDYERGLAGVVIGPRVYVSTSTRPSDEPAEGKST